MTAKYLLIACFALVLTACGSSDPEEKPTIEAPPPKPISENDKGVFDWFSASKDGKSTDERKTSVAVNAYLWRASLDTLSFMPMDNADPFGGTIKTGWYTPAATPNERLRVAVYILDSRLRADALRVSVFKEVKKPSGDWIDATVDPDTVTKLENLILNKARALKIQAGD